MKPITEMSLKELEIEKSLVKSRLKVNPSAKFYLDAIIEEIENRLS